MKSFINTAHNQKLVLGLFLSVSLQVVLCADFDPLQSGQAEQLQQQYLQLKELSLSQSDSWEIWLQLGITLQSLDHNFPNGGKRVPEAEAAYKKAVALTDRTDMHCLAYGNLGVLQMSSGRGDDALESYELALDAVARDQTANCGSGAGTIYNRGKALTMLGRMQEAQKSHEEAVNAARSTDASVYSKAFASLKNFSENLEEELMFVVDLLAGLKDLNDFPQQITLQDAEWMKTELSKMDECWLNFAAYTMLENKMSQNKYNDIYYNSTSDISQIFTVEDRTKAEEIRKKAWFHLERGNKLQREFLDYSVKKDEATIAALKQIFGSKFGPAGYPSKVPIFIVGVPRSGSTLIEQMLASHSKVFGAGEDTAFAPLTRDLMEAMSGAVKVRCAREDREKIRGRNDVVGARGTYTRKREACQNR
eukprot:TRINITY_DN4009_c0_g1_i3.p1 TRINITY_DN4009_c0_g1~~TRINITY_DN4009_c0_g1_i3.p1  ORF type:complete len:435 (+),score=58.70 TRINITY_DN4009_c0_g1_i3:43-1305(+)